MYNNSILLYVYNTRNVTVFYNINSNENLISLLCFSCTGIYATDD